MQQVIHTTWNSKKETLDFRDRVSYKFFTKDFVVTKSFSKNSVLNYLFNGESPSSNKL